MKERRLPLPADKRLGYFRGVRKDGSIIILHRFLGGPRGNVVKHKGVYAGPERRAEMQS